MWAMVMLKQFIQRHRWLNTAVMAIHLRTVHPMALRIRARRKRLAVVVSGGGITVSRGDKAIRIGIDHAIYARDIIDYFDYFFDAVVAVQEGSARVVDYSAPADHVVVGYDRHPIYFPALAEPVITTQQYIDFAALTEGSVAIDLGAYSGLTSIMFRERCGASGRVVAVDADATNVAAIRRNVARYECATGNRVDVLEGAVWRHDDGISFSSEGNLGSSATDVVGDRLGAATFVPSFTLSTIATRCEMAAVDFIKCDIEGAEAMIFADDRFFARFRPRIMVEAHRINGLSTADKVTATLARYGYRCSAVIQHGVDLPLIECRPSA